MNLSKNNISKLTVKLGFWSSVICALTFIVYTICFLLIAVVNQLFTWSDLSHYVTYVTNNNQILKHTAMFFMIIFGISYVVLLNSIKSFADEDRKLLANISINFGLIFTTLIGINYFLQISTVRLSINMGQTTGLEQFIQSNPNSAVAAVNMLGWTVFFGLSSLFVSTVFNHNKLERVIRYAFLTNSNEDICPPLMRFDM